MLRGKYLQFAIRLILTQWCHLPQRFGLLVYLGRQAGGRGHLLSEHHLLVLGDPRGNLTTLATPRPPPPAPELPPPSQPHTGVFTPLPNMENHTPIRHNPAASIQDGNPWPIRVFLVGKASRHPAGRLGSGPPCA